MLVRNSCFPALTRAFFSLRKKFNQHLFSYVTTRRDRQTAIEPNKCPLLPGGLGQLVAQALELTEDQPYLLLWAWLSVAEPTELTGLCP